MRTDNAALMNSKNFIMQLNPGGLGLRRGGGERGCWSNFRGEFFLMNVELLTFLCRQIIKPSIHTVYDMIPK